MKHGSCIGWYNSSLDCGAMAGFEPATTDLQPVALPDELHRPQTTLMLINFLYETHNNFPRYCLMFVFSMTIGPINHSKQESSPLLAELSSQITLRSSNFIY